MLLLSGAIALAREPTVGVLVMPITPSEGPEPYQALIEAPGAGALAWTSEVPGFHCRGVGDWLEVTVAPASWPSAVPDKVSCAAGGRHVRVKVEIAAARHEPMFVADGTLVMPRERNGSVIFEGPPPTPDVVAQQGRTADLTVHCDVKAGPTLVVVVDPGARDGSGYCLLKDRFGATTRVPVSVVTVR